MNKPFCRVAAALAAFCATFLVAAPAAAATSAGNADTLFVVLDEGGVDAFPTALVDGVEDDGIILHIGTIDNKSFRYEKTALRTYTRHVAVAVPQITSFKFNNKFNPQLFSDAEFDIVGDSILRGEVAAIGRRLTPSFQLSDKRAQVFMNDTVRLRSKHSRLSFADARTITVAYPGMRVLSAVVAQPATPPSEEQTLSEVALTEDMLSTNAPSNFPATEGLDKLLDDDPGTFFHSTWGDGPNAKLDLSEAPYIEITLPEPLHRLQYAVQNRSDTDSRSAEELQLQASTDGRQWTTVDIFNTSNGLSTGRGAVNTSAVVELAEPCARLRLVMTKANYKNYFCLSRLSLYEVDTQVTPGREATYACSLVPLGRRYEFQMDWLADRPGAIPAVYVQTAPDAWGYSEPPYSKSEYADATISIDGAGVFPDMADTLVQIRGRGNSSWSGNYWSKNPYRIKFGKKMKPFGMTKGKSWVLQSNRQAGSMLTNPIGMYAAALAGTEAANHYLPVDLYMNGLYWGSYTFTEKVGFSNNSIDLPDESRAARLELDTYTDETIYRSSPGNLPVKIKDPDFADAEAAPLITPAEVMNRFNTFARLVEEGKDISPEVDVESLARFLMVNELIGNKELMHPKSTFLFHENVTDYDTRFRWGPVWDLDWAYGYEGTSTYFLQRATDDYWTSTSMEATSFMRKLRRAGEPLDRAVYKTWTLFMRDHLDDLIDYVADYYAFARPSLEHNNAAEHRSDRDYTDYAANAANAQRWLRQRAQYVYRQQTPYDLTDEELALPEPDLPVDDYSEIVVGTTLTDMSAAPQRFDVYDLRGRRLKAGAAYDRFRDGLRPGLYIVNGKKVLLP